MRDSRPSLYLLGERSDGGGVPLPRPRHKKHISASNMMPCLSIIEIFLRFGAEGHIKAPSNPPLYTLAVDIAAISLFQHEMSLKGVPYFQYEMSLNGAPPFEYRMSHAASLFLFMMGG